MYGKTSTFNFTGSRVGDRAGATVGSSVEAGWGGAEVGDAAGTVVDSATTCGVAVEVHAVRIMTNTNGTIMLFEMVFFISSLLIMLF